MHRPTRFAAALAALAVVAGLAIGASPSRPAAAEELRVLLDWFVNPDHAPLFVALEKGFFTERDLEVTFVAPTDPSSPPKLVAAGQADIAVSYQPQLHLQVARACRSSESGRSSQHP